jgi:hypothetical protein
MHQAINEQNPQQIARVMGFSRTVIVDGCHHFLAYRSQFLPTAFVLLRPLANG